MYLIRKQPLNYIVLLCNGNEVLPKNKAFEFFWVHKFSNRANYSFVQKSAKN